MRIGVFAYNFKHWKTQAGIQNLLMAGYKPDVIYAADSVELKFYKSQKRIVPKDLFLFHPHQIALHNQIDYRVLVHNSEDTVSSITRRNLDVGVILGARVLKKEVIEAFNVGVLNMHPGLLPENRGLDTIKWSIIKGMPVGVTCHLVDESVDRGRIVKKRKIKVYSDDTLLDLHIRVQNLEQEMMLESLRFLESEGPSGLEFGGVGEYHKSVPPEIEKDLGPLFGAYKRTYAL